MLLKVRAKLVKPVEYVHTDSVSILLSKVWQEFLDVNNILASSSDSKTKQNQVSERFNFWFKTNLRKKIIRVLNKKFDTTLFRGPQKIFKKNHSSKTAY